jgi:hypothetical protein
MAVDLAQMLANAKAVGSRVIGIAENNDQLSRDGILPRPSDNYHFVA